MSIQKPPYSMIASDVRAAADSRSQFGAVCYRRRSNGKPEILLVTSRGTGRWIVPKGWPVPGRAPAACAATEAFEEAGAEGRVWPVCLGVYSYLKDVDGAAIPCVVALYPLSVTRMLRKFPERGQRKRKWASPKRAAGLVDQPELGAILRGFDPAAWED